ncbi:MAG: lamin tail domain-containing protein [Treponema sp.]|nr:lamin tail domain-containing protein [Treponema sp.]
MKKMSLPAGVFRAGCLFFGFLVSLFPACSMDEVAQVLGRHSQAPAYLGFRAAKLREMQFNFSQPVEVLSFVSNPPLPVQEIINGAPVRVILAEDVIHGEAYTADLLVRDGEGNTLNVLLPFRSRNERIPGILINELRTEYSKPKTEFVELKTLEEGNLGALRLFIAGYTANPLVFEFPPVEVDAGEYILIHLRSIESGENVMVNETGTDLALSGGTEANAAARDFWVPSSEKPLHKTDAVYLMDQDDRVIDAVMLSEQDDPWWSKEHFVRAADLLCQQGAWTQEGGKISGPADAVITAGIKSAMTRSICRDEDLPDTNTKADWYIVDTGKASPGAKNNPIP